MYKLLKNTGRENLFSMVFFYPIDKCQRMMKEIQRRIFGFKQEGIIRCKIMKSLFSCKNFFRESSPRQLRPWEKRPGIRDHDQTILSVRKIKVYIRKKEMQMKKMEKSRWARENGRRDLFGDTWMSFRRLKANITTWRTRWNLIDLESFACMFAEPERSQNSIFLPFGNIFRRTRYIFI